MTDISTGSMACTGVVALDLTTVYITKINGKVCSVDHCVGGLPSQAHWPVVLRLHPSEHSGV